VYRIQVSSSNFPTYLPALHWTAEKGNEAVVQLLVEKGADEESEDADAAVVGGSEAGTRR
jgi:hypothetical protein